MCSLAKLVPTQQKNPDLIDMTASQAECKTGQNEISYVIQCSRDCSSTVTPVGPDGVSNSSTNFYSTRC